MWKFKGQMSHIFQKSNKYFLQISSLVILRQVECTFSSVGFSLLLNKPIFCKSNYWNSTFYQWTFATTAVKKHRQSTVYLFFIWNLVVISLHQIKYLRCFCNEIVFFTSICRAYLTYQPTLPLIRSMLFSKVSIFSPFLESSQQRWKHK